MSLTSGPNSKSAFDEMRERPVGSALPLVLSISDVVKLYGSGEAVRTPIHNGTNSNTTIMIDLISLLLQILLLAISVYDMMSDE
ncbi:MULTISPECIES: hypothetical protein [Halobacterium]|uniref:hypothetical protein n=1 Tax=Halobacterium TaxID=2239 RepID=UPI0012F72A2B|nr:MULTISPECIES: hypothetical protein [Halobacterium]MCG1003511.1 hypothetical protein [Halobacterium noricense]